MGVVNGYVTGRMLRGFALTDWTGHTAKTALAFPSVVFGVVFALNLLIWGRRSAAAVPFGACLFIECLFISSFFLFRVSFYLRTGNWNDVFCFSFLQVPSSLCSCCGAPSTRRWCTSALTLASRRRRRRHPCVRTRSHGRSRLSRGTCRLGSAPSSAEYSHSARFSSSFSSSSRPCGKFILIIV